jgi:hypothetical protein
MRNLIRLSVAAALCAAASQAQTQTQTQRQTQTPTPDYAGVSYGTGPGKCPSYLMSVEVTVTGNDVKGLFQQKDRTKRHFEATRDASGAFKTQAVVGGRGKMTVSGTLRPEGGVVLLEGYCRFDTKLVRRP